MMIRTEMKSIRRSARVRHRCERCACQLKSNPAALANLVEKNEPDWLKETDMATRLENAISRVIKEGKVRTYDMGGKASTLDMAQAVADYAS
jgi:isocitrate dehydrogenase (NAD+)